MILKMCNTLKKQGNEADLYYQRIEHMAPKVTAGSCFITRSRLCLTLLMSSAFLTVQYGNCQQLLSAINTFRDNNKREIQQQQQIRFLSNILNLENSFKSSSNFFIKYRPINHNESISNNSFNRNENNSSSDIFPITDSQILIVFNDTLHNRHIGLINKIYRSFDLNEHVRLDYINKSYMMRSAGTYNKQNINNSRLLKRKTDFAANLDVTGVDSDVLNEPDKENNPLATNINNKLLLKMVMDGLGLLNLPDMNKVNISQQEYVTKYKEYVKRVNDRNKHELSLIRGTMDQQYWKEEYAPLQMLSIVHNSSKWQNHLRHRRDLNTRAATVSHGTMHHQKDKTSIILHFPLDLNATLLKENEIEEANIKLMLISSPSLAMKKGGYNARNKHYHKTPTDTVASTQPRKHTVNIKVYQLLEKGQRRWLDGRKVSVELDRTKLDESQSHWLEFDVTKAVESWLSNRQSNLGLEVKCENCYRHGARIIDDLSIETQEYNEVEAKVVKNDQEPSGRTDSDRFNLTPVLNVIGRLGATYHEHRSRERNLVYAQHHYTDMKSSNRKPSRKADCYKQNQRCCRHPMQVVFKEIKGFEFIIQPKVFDAGFCRGRCPPRFNPAHHHAMLQSLIWKQNRTRVPRPCCAPSKLVELEVLHVDEKDSDKLKISTWTDMRVLECACS